MQPLSITFGMALGGASEQVRSTHMHVVADIRSDAASAGTISGRLLYLLPHQLRQIQNGENVVVRFEGKSYRFLRIEKDGTFELRREA
jgi:hypothetical protein